MQARGQGREGRTSRCFWVPGAGVLLPESWGSGLLPFPGSVQMAAWALGEAKAGGVSPRDRAVPKMVLSLENQDKCRPETSSVTPRLLGKAPQLRVKITP